MFSLSLNFENADSPLVKRALFSALAGLVLCCIALTIYLMFFAAQTRSLGMALLLSAAVVIAALFTGPLAVVQLLMGMRGSYHAFQAVTTLIVYVLAVYLQIKFIPPKILVLLTGVDVFVLVFALWMARLYAW
ncbi:MAG: hypothetical protein H6858_05595 [Rhodospirillales bacterium]|nr:hypothetical protein [Alphaproteobacteria bacterium]MCB9977049.1 hypothetical protein [Rhodospirillales bacterium]